MREQFSRLYARVRKRELVLESEISGRDIIEFTSFKVTEKFRGILSGNLGAFIGRDVRIVGRRHVEFGKDVAIGCSCRIFAVSRTGVKVGDRSTIDQGAIILASGVLRNLGHGVHIGTDTAIGAFNVIHGGGGVHIGNDCLLGPHVAIYSENHNYGDPGLPIRLQGESRGPVHIEDDVWIGTHAVILPNVTVGTGSVVAAGSVVTRSVPPRTVVAGVPARRIRDRE